MFGFERKKNIPDTLPPTTPNIKGRNPRDKGIYITEFVFNLKMETIEGRLKNSNIILTVAFIALIICFLTLFFGYWQFASSSYNEYSQRIKELNDNRFDYLINRIKDVENKTAATQSAR